MKKKNLLWMTLCVLFLFVFAGCAGANGDSEDDDSESSDGGFAYGGDILVEYQSCGGGLVTYEESCFDTVYRVMTDKTIYCYLECSDPEIAPAVIDVFTVDMPAETYEKLYKLVDKKDVLSLNPKEEQDVCDGYSYYLRMYDENNKLVGQVGGYMPSNKTMEKIRALITQDIPLEKRDEIIALKYSYIEEYESGKNGLGADGEGNSGTGDDEDGNGGADVAGNQEAREIYFDFLRGNGTVSTTDYFAETNENYYGAIQPGEYSYSQLKAAYESYEGHAATTAYTFVDLGNDGTEELFLRFDNTDSSFMNWVGVIRCENNALKLTYAYEDGYRTWSALYESGYLNIGGSFGAGAHADNYLKFNDKGEAEELFALNYFNGSFATQISYDLTQDMASIDDMWEYASALGDADSELQITEYIPPQRDGTGVKICVGAYSTNAAAKEIEGRLIEELVSMGAELIAAEDLSWLTEIPEIDDSREVEWIPWEEIS